MEGYQDLSALEKSVDTASSQLYTVVHKLHAVELSLDGTTTMEDMDDLCVLELLESMTEVKNEYQNLRKDLQEVQQLQRDVTTSIRYQMRSMHRTFQMLKKRIETKATNRNSSHTVDAAVAAFVTSGGGTDGGATATSIQLN